jgi:hypothetical protein
MGSVGSVGSMGLDGARWCYGEGFGRRRGRHGREQRWKLRTMYGVIALAHGRAKSIFLEQVRFRAPLWAGEVSQFTWSSHPSPWHGAHPQARGLSWIMAGEAVSMSRMQATGAGQGRAHGDAPIPHARACVRQGRVRAGCVVLCCVVSCCCFVSCCVGWVRVVRSCQACGSGPATGCSTPSTYY